MYSQSFINRSALFLTAMILMLSLYGQELYMPRDVKKAYENGTRIMSGKPSSKYWQNRARYDITITAAPPDKMIKGTEKITYINNSPDTLRSLVIRLFLNMHKPGAVRNKMVSEEYLTDGMRINSYVVNGEPRRWPQKAQPSTWNTAPLAVPLAPGDSVKIAFDWQFEIATESDREGMIDPTTWFLAYFYPRVAVYDDYAGWDRIEFTDQQEFYNDFNDYKVTVKVPANYLVWGTGDLQKPETVLQPEYTNRYVKSLTTDELIHIATPEELKSGKVTQQSMNSWTFTCTNVPDVAFAISDHFVWDASSVVVDDRTGRRASVQAAYMDTAADFRRMVEFGRHSLSWLSKNWPGIPYPYSKTTVVQGFADMEYPMMVNDATTPDPEFSRFVAEHEIAHTYFPFYMGINESRFAFMDEGWATTFELLIGRHDLGKEKAEKNYKFFRVNGWIRDLSMLQDIPIITPADVLRSVSYGNNAYGKPSLGYLALMDLLGEEQFKKSLHAFMNDWNGKHPLPWDMFYSFNTSSGQNLNWFWHQWFFTNGYSDVAVEQPVKNKKNWEITIKNIGGFPIPVDILIQYADGSSETIHQTPQFWKANMKEAKVLLPSTKEISAVSLATGIYMDANEANNQWKK